MKKTLSLVVMGVMLILTLGLVAAVASSGVGNPDNECQNNGFDYGIAKYECGDSNVEELGSKGEDYTLSVAWRYNDEKECAWADWTANPAVDGVLLKAGKADTVALNGGLSGTVEKQRYAISHITFCGNYNDPTVPEFGTVIGMVTALGALGVFFLVRRK